MGYPNLSEGKNMWLRFTERARKVVFFAQEEAQKFGEGYVSTEHLLLGLVRESDSVAARVLERLGVSLARIRAEIEKQLPRGEARQSQDMTLTPRAKRVIDLAHDEAGVLGNSYIGTEHILLGLVREGDGLAGRVLGKLGVELEKTREQLRIVINSQKAPEESESITTKFPNLSAVVPKPSSKENHLNECIALLKDIANFNDGKGEYDFSSLSGNDRENAAFDAWMKIRERLDTILAFP